MTDAIPSSGAKIHPPGAVGVIINPRSHANKKRAIDTGKLLARHPALLVETPVDQAALHMALAAFAAAGISLLVVNGGDGTLRDVLSALPAAFTALPEIAILPAGNTNLAARVLGSAGRGAAGLERLLRARAAGRLRRRTCPMLRVSWPGEPIRLPLHGFLFGAAAFTDAKLLADSSIHRRGVHRGFAVAAAVFAAAATALWGRNDRLRRGTFISVGIDGAPPTAGARFLLLATTLDRLMFGLWPFWGARAGGLHWLDIAAPPVRLGSALLAILRRRPQGWMSRNGYHSGWNENLIVKMDQPFMLDGEAFDPGPGGIMLSAGGLVTVVRP